MRKTILALSVAAFLAVGSYAADHKEVHWDYDAHGPSHWGEFGETCQLGKVQSPINILSKQTSPFSAGNTLKLDENVNSKVTVLDNGHAIQVNVENGGKITVDGVDYKLLQFHFHGKSEEQIDGKHSDLVAHMVHKSAFGNLLVVAVLFDEGKTANKTVQNVIDSVGKSITMNSGDLLPKNTNDYFHFMGSLTTPPCSENVKWYVMKDIQSVSKEQVAALRKYYANNYRPIQPLNGRSVESK